MKGKRGHFWLDFVACFLIPAYTLLFAGSVQWFGTNFSVIAVTGPDHYRGFIYWGVLAGGYFLVLLNALAATLPQPGARLTVRVLTAAALLSLPEKNREIIFLYFFGNYRQWEIGEMYGRCRSTTGYQIHRTLKLLRKEMEVLSHGESESYPL